MSQAIRLHQHGGPEVLQWETVERPEPGPGQVRVRHAAIGVNFIDVYYRTGLYPHALPHGLGMEAAGVIDAVGEGVTHVQVGDRVSYAMSQPGAYAEVHVIDAKLAIRLPEAISFEAAAALTLKGLTVRYLMRQTFPLQGGETILFHAAAGGVGLIACQWARALGVRLIGTVSSPEKAAQARAHGAWEVIDYTRENVAARVRELTDGRGVPVVYDSVGQSTFEASLDSLQPRGLLVSFGNASGPVTGVALSTLVQKGSLYVTRPSLAHYNTTAAEWQAAADEMFGLVAAGKIEVAIGQRFPVAEAAEAHRALEQRQTQGATLLTLD